MAISATKTTVFNRTLVLLGKERITSWQDEKHAPRVLRDMYDETLDYMLEQHPWSFAKASTELADSGAVSTGDGWTYRYALPVDFLNVVTINNTDVTNRLDQFYEIRGQELFSNESQVFMTYIFREEIVGRWTAKFMNAFSYALARDASPQLSEGAGTLDMLNAKAEQSLAEAKAMDMKRQNRHSTTKSNNKTYKARTTPWTR